MKLFFIFVNSFSYKLSASSSKVRENQNVPSIPAVRYTAAVLLAKRPGGEVVAFQVPLSAPGVGIGRYASVKCRLAPTVKQTGRESGCQLIPQFRILMVSAVKIDKQCLQTHNISLLGFGSQLAGLHIHSRNHT